MFDFAAFSNPDLNPPRAKKFVPPRVRNIHFNENKNYEKDSVSLSLDENTASNAHEEEDKKEKIIHERVKRPKLVVEKKEKKDENKENEEEPKEKVLTVETKAPSLYVDPQQPYQMPYVYGYPAQYLYPPNFSYADNYQYPDEYPFQIQYPNGLPTVQLPVGDQQLLDLNAPYLGTTAPQQPAQVPPMDQFAQANENQQFTQTNENQQFTQTTQNQQFTDGNANQQFTQSNENQQLNQPNENQQFSQENENQEFAQTNENQLADMNAEGISSESQPPQIVIDAPFGNDLEKPFIPPENQQVPDEEQQQQEQQEQQQQQEAQPEGPNMQDPNMMMPQMMVMIDPYTGMPFEVPMQMMPPQDGSGSSDYPFQQIGFEKSNLSTPGLIVQKSLNAKPYIPEIDEKQVPIIDPSGLSIEKPNVNKSLKLTWLPPGISTKEKVSPEEVIKKSGIVITKKKDLQYEHLVLETKEHPEEEPQPVENVLTQPPSMFQNPPIFQAPSMFQAPPTMFQMPEQKTTETTVKPPTMFQSPEIVTPPKLPQMSFISTETSESSPHNLLSDAQTQDNIIPVPAPSIPITIKPNLEMVDSSTDAGDDDQVSLEQQAYYEMLKARQAEAEKEEEPAKPKPVTPPSFTIPTSQNKQSTTMNPFATPSPFAQAPSSPFATPNPFAQASTSQFGRPPVFGAPSTATSFTPSTARFVTPPSFGATFTAPSAQVDMNKADEQAPVFIQPTILSQENAQPLPRSDTSTDQSDILPIPVVDQSSENPEQAAYNELLRQRHDSPSEFSSDVYAQITESEKQVVEEPAQQEVIVNEPVIDHDLDDLLGIV